MSCFCAQQVVLQLSGITLLQTCRHGNQAFHSLRPACPTLLQAMGTRAATCFAWHEPSQILAVAVRRKVLLLTLSGSDLVDKGEQLVPEPPVCMMWTGAASVAAVCGPWTVGGM